MICIIAQGFLLECTIPNLQVLKPYILHICLIGTVEAQNLKRDDVGSDLCEQSLIGVHGILSAQTTVGIIDDVAVALMEVFLIQRTSTLIDGSTLTDSLQCYQIIGNLDI